MPSQPRSRRFPRRDRSQHDPAGPARQSAQQSAQHPIDGTRRRTPRLVLAGVSAAALVAAVMALPGHAPTTPRVDLKELHRASSGGGMTLEGPRGERFDIHGAVGDGERDALSRAGTSASDPVDPTTAAERAASTRYVDRERALPDPKLRGTRAYPRRTKTPRTKYALANGCYTLVPGGTPLYFKPTALGTYLIQDPDSQLLVPGGTVDEAAAEAVWTAELTGKQLTLTQDGEPLTIDGASSFRATRASGCTAYPEADVNVRGNPHGGVSDFQEVRGYVDGHTHHMAFEFLGGMAHCGKPWDPFGAPFALVDCIDHTTTGGYGAVLEAALSGRPNHDPVGWPTFVDWPAPDSLTHEGTYYRWMERAWRGGQRIFVNLLVENNQLCQLYPLKRNSCDDMDSVRLQAAQTYAFQDYVDAQFGGPGKGFYRIVTSPYEAREVINDGKMAVILGIETSVPFGCTFKNVPLVGDVPACDEEEIATQIDEMHDLGVRQMEIVNKFDNALSGIAGDAGETGVLVNSANFLETGTFWDMQHCEPEDGESADKTQYAAPDISAGQQDALFGAIAMLSGTLALPALPLYPTPLHCNSRGLTTLGEHTINELAKRHIIFDPDHMSVKARNAALDQIEEMGYHGLISSHSWSTLDAYPRVYRAGGIITAYAGGSTGFVEKWRSHQGWADPRYYWGFGFGADINGLGAQGGPRGADVPNPVTYPFRGLGGVRVDQQVAGERVYDINVDGVAQYGLYPDWIQDLSLIAEASKKGDGAKILDDMARGAEAYLQMWERAYGIAPDSCRNPGNRLPVGTVQKKLRRGMSTTKVMKVVGQPYTRLGRSFGFCAKDGRGKKVELTATFNGKGKLRKVKRT